MDKIIMAFIYQSILLRRISKQPSGKRRERSSLRLDVARFSWWNLICCGTTYCVWYGLWTVCGMGCGLCVVVAWDLVCVLSDGKTVFDLVGGMFLIVTSLSMELFLY